MQLSQQEMHAVLISRHGAAVQQALSAAVVGVAGLGGLGSHIAVQLARLGVGRLILADFDVVEPSNLHRQHYTMHDLGKHKTDALTAQLREINPYLRYDTYAVRVTPENAPQIFADCTVVCEAFDSAAQKAMLIEVLLTALARTPLVSGVGMAGDGSANTIETRRRLSRLYVCGDGVSAVSDELGLLAPRVALCAAHMAHMALRLILGETAP